MPQRFVQAEWRRLIMANYAVDPVVLSRYLPAKTELDYWNGECYVSLVGFMFKNVRVRGIRIPFHVNFPEINLRFYVRYKEQEQWKRGVVFITEIVPKYVVSFIANTFFYERYRTLPMRFAWTDGASLLKTAYHWKKNNRWNKLEAITEPQPISLENGSMEEFITEHFWGYSSGRNNSTNEYKVEHPRWDIYKVNEYLVDCDFRAQYGSEFADLQSAKPLSVFMAEGSAVNIFLKKIL
jgi:uncharacterized protein YqjF (DUF2071 family)